MTIKVGNGFEVEASFCSLFIRFGRFERYWNLRGLPSH